MFTITIILPILCGFALTVGVFLLGDIDINTSITQINSSIGTGKTSDNKHTYYYNTTQDDKCKQMFEWSMIHQWESDNQKDSNAYDGKDGVETMIDFDNLPQVRHLHSLRMGGAKSGTIDMHIRVQSKNLQLTVVDTRVFTGMSEPKQVNVWHRMVSQYGSWVGLQMAERRYNLQSNRTVYLFNCDDGKFSIHDLPTEWAKIGELTCDSTILSEADVIIEPPFNGLLWDLAWDLNFHCHNSDMFKSFALLLSNKTASLDPLGCFISRQGRGLREVENFKETIEMMKEIFPRVREVKVTTDHTIDNVIDMLYECRVLFGIHGAGHMNAIFARPGVAVVEMIGTDRPAYFRNINMLMGQHYESIKGDSTKGIKDAYYHVDLEEAREALLRARDHANLWFEEHGHWR